MYQLIRPIRIFFLLFQVAKPVPVRDALPAVILLAVWITTALLGAMTAVSLAISAAFVTFLALHLPALLPRLSLIAGPGISAACALLIATLPLIHLTGADATAAQRLLTVGPLLVASVYALGLMEHSGAVLRVIWPDARMQAMRDDIARVMLMKQLTLALLNETLIVTVTPGTWIAVAALLPFAWHYVTSALTTAVFLSHQHRS